MLPRGEVGLIFATLGLQNGVLGDDLYAALLLVVLVTTLVTPQLLKIRYAQLRGRRRAGRPPPRTRRRPTAVGSTVNRDEVGLAARPPDELRRAARPRRGHPAGPPPPDPALLDWLADAAPPAHVVAGAHRRCSST